MNPAPDTLVPGSSTTGRAASAAARARRLRWLGLLGVALLAMVLVRGFLVQSFAIPSGSMEPTLAPGDRILVTKLAAASALRRGDVVVFDGTQSFAGGDASSSANPLGRVLSAAASLLSVQTDQTDYVKRVVGTPGDRVTCCDAFGRVQVDGTPVEETYLYPGDKPSDRPFDVVVPAGRIWVLGDHRSDSADSRAHLGDPGGGMVRLSDVVGRVSVVYWPLSRLGTVQGSDALSGLAGGGGG